MIERDNKMRRREEAGRMTDTSSGKTSRANGS